MKTFIISVSTNEQRRKHMLQLIGLHPCLQESCFVYEGDIDMISQEVRLKYFGDVLLSHPSALSCAYKHILAYRKLLESEQDTHALILEDDIFLSKDFCVYLERVLAEVAQRKLENVLISLEESSLQYVKGSERKKDLLLYKKTKGRMAAAYLIDRQAAKSMLQEIEQNKCNQPIDWFHNYCADHGLIDIYWSHPAIAVQGSLNGRFNSLIDHDKPIGWIKIFRFEITRFYKKVLYKLR